MIFKKPHHIMINTEPMCTFWKSPHPNNTITTPHLLRVMCSPHSCAPMEACYSGGGGKPPAGAWGVLCRRRRLPQTPAGGGSRGWWALAQSLATASRRYCTPAYAITPHALRSPSGYTTNWYHEQRMSPYKDCITIVIIDPSELTICH